MPSICANPVSPQQQMRVHTLPLCTAFIWVKKLGLLTSVGRKIYTVAWLSADVTATVRVPDRIAGSIEITWVPQRS